MTMPGSLFTKIMLWFFLNLLILGAILFLIFNFRFDSRPGSFLGSSSRIEAVTRSFENEINTVSSADYDELLKKYSDVYNVRFFLFDYQGQQLGGAATNLPREVYEDITRAEPAFSAERPPIPLEPREPRGGLPNRPPRGAPMSGYYRTAEPTTYWFVGRITLFDQNSQSLLRARLIAASDSFTGRGLFFDPMPFVIVAGIVIGFSIIFWLPFVRHITRAVGQMTAATEQIAEENFDARVSENRSDELGRLGKSINHLATRLAGFVRGQKRFLGDISHELNSPLARMQFALSILEDRVDENNRAYVEDVKEEVELMSKLVAELLTYSKAGIVAPEINLERVRLRPLVEDAARRESDGGSYEINLEIDENAEVSAHKELLARAVGNVVRNAVRYAGQAGAISIRAENTGNQTRISIADSGAGVPDAELDKLFDPFYRVAAHRSRETGGTGLGLAIVKTCIEACQGKVFARNLAPKGFEIVITLQS